MQVEIHKAFIRNDLTYIIGGFLFAVNTLAPALRKVKSKTA